MYAHRRARSWHSVLNQHIRLVRSWFKGAMPKMGGYAADDYKDSKHSGGLEAICYSRPEGASFQRVWDLIRVRQAGNHVFVDAHGSWVAREESGSFRYQTEYELVQENIKLVAHKELPIQKNRK